MKNINEKFNVVIHKLNESDGTQELFLPKLSEAIVKWEWVPLIGAGPMAGDIQGTLALQTTATDDILSELIALNAFQSPEYVSFVIDIIYSPAADFSYGIRGNQNQLQAKTSLIYNRFWVSIDDSDPVNSNRNFIKLTKGTSCTDDLILNLEFKLYNIPVLSIRNSHTFDHYPPEQ